MRKCEYAGYKILRMKINYIFLTTKVFLNEKIYHINKDIKVNIVQLDKEMLRNAHFIISTVEISNS